MNRDPPVARDRQKPKLLDQVRSAIRARHYSIGVEDAYVQWIKRFMSGIKDVDFQYRQLATRDGKGRKDRVTMPPGRLIDPLKQHLARVKANIAKPGPVIRSATALQRIFCSAAMTFGP